MKTNKKDTSKRTAIEFIKDMETTMGMMESISNEIVGEYRETLVESYATVTDDDVFDMSSLLDVKINDESNEPRIYTSPIPELTDSDKGLIIDEFTKMIRDSHETVIDFSDIGPIATVIQDRFGFKQNIENFLQDVVQKASDWQQSQKVAVTDIDTAGEEITGASNAPIDETDSPTDIAPDQEGINDNNMDVPTEPIIDPIVDTEVNELTDEPIDDIVEPIDETETSGEDSEYDVDDESLSMVESDIENMEIDDNMVEDDELAEVSDMDDVDFQLESIKNKIKSSESIKSLVESAVMDIQRANDIEVQLESIKNELTEKALVEASNCKKTMVEETDEDEVIEAMKDKTAKKLAISDIKEMLGKDLGELADVDADEFDVLEESNDVKKKDIREINKKNTMYTKPIGKSPKYKRQNIKDIIEEDFYDLEDIDALEESKVSAQLESIANTYHSKQQAKVKEKKLEAQLEAIANKYKSKVALVESQKEREKTIDSKLEALVESYHKTQTTEKTIDSKLEALVESYHKTQKNETSNEKARVSAKERLQKIMKK
jgi:hypothetical protein